MHIVESANFSADNQFFRLPGEDNPEDELQRKELFGKLNGGEDINFEILNAKFLTSLGIDQLKEDVGKFIMHSLYKCRNLLK